MPRQRQRSQASRFRIQHPDGTWEPLSKVFETPGAALSKALGYADGVDVEPGVWTVTEWEDEVYRVHRLPAEKLDVRVEVM